MNINLSNQVLAKRLSESLEWQEKYCKTEEDKEKNFRRCIKSFCRNIIIEFDQFGFSESKWKDLEELVLFYNENYASGLEANLIRLKKYKSSDDRIIIQLDLQNYFIKVKI